MNKIINLLCFLLAINLLVLGNLLIKTATHQSFLPISYAKNLIHSNDNYNLILRILKDTNKENLIKYVNYIDIKVTNEIPNDSKNKIAFTLSLPEQISFIAIYDKISDTNLNFEYIIDNLASVNTFYYYKDFIIIEQSSNNASENITSKEFFEVFYKKDNQFISVFNKNIYSEKIVKKNNNNDILKTIETASIDHLEGSIPRILSITTLIEYIGFNSNLNITEEFNEVNKSTIKEIYEWSNTDEKFILSESKTINK
ncbi:MAG: hypothetical protein RR942_17445 [Romboutsia sp.]